MYLLKEKKAMRTETVTFSKINMRESDIEEILRCNVDMLCDDEASCEPPGQY